MVLRRFDFPRFVLLTLYSLLCTASCAQAAVANHGCLAPGWGPDQHNTTPRLNLPHASPPVPVEQIAATSHSLVSIPTISSNGSPRPVSTIHLPPL